MSRLHRSHILFYFVPWRYHTHLSRYFRTLSDSPYLCRSEVIMWAWYIDHYHSFSTPISCCVDGRQKIAAADIQPNTLLHDGYEKPPIAPLGSTWKIGQGNMLLVCFDTICWKYMDRSDTQVVWCVVFFFFASKKFGSVRGGGSVRGATLAGR